MGEYCGGLCTDVMDVNFDSYVMQKSNKIWTNKNHL